uniref:Uncharacterized protein n=1 Tax=viral metagenome TaxID=1070528 RepID=A0A6C0HLR6_9ZZZZ
MRQLLADILRLPVIPENRDTFLEASRNLSELANSLEAHKEDIRTSVCNEELLENMNKTYEKCCDDPNCNKGHDEFLYKINMFDPNGSSGNFDDIYPWLQEIMPLRWCFGAYLLAFIEGINETADALLNKANA